MNTNMRSTDGFPKEAGRVYFDGSAFLWADTSAGIYYKQGWKLEWLKKTTIKAISK